MGGNGIVFVISAPSGTGKTTLCRALKEDFDDLVYSVSYTSRAPREGEVDGRDYFFVSEKQFSRMIKEGCFAEWAVVHGHYYGTARTVIEEALKGHRDLLLDIDTQGARQIKNCYPSGVYIFVAPPSEEELKERLKGRRTETDEQMEARLQRAEREMRERQWYDFVVVNDDFSEALANLKAIILAERCHTHRMIEKRNCKM